MIYKVYHKSNAKFNHFDISFKQESSARYGLGFNFSFDELEDLDLRYLYTCNVTLNNPITKDKNIISNKQWEDFIIALNFYWITDYEKYKDDDYEIYIFLSKIYEGDYSKFLKAAVDILGVDGLIDKEANILVSFDPANIKITDIEDSLNLKELLTEDTRLQLANASKNVGTYKDQSYGKNRFERKKLSKIAANVKQYNNIDMNALFKQDELQVEIPVIGETDNYSVTVKMSGVIAELAKNIKNNNYKLEFRSVLQALTKTFNTADIKVNCTCQDYLFHYAHWNIIHGVSTLDSAHDPGPGKGTANPNDDQGRGCKHVLLILANGDWMMKVASVINNYIHYMSEKMQKPFLKLIFPKLYGCDAEEMAKKDILGKDEVEETLESGKSFIDAINEYGKNRGKFRKGSNVNPVYADELEKEQKAKEDDISQQEDPNKKNLDKAEKETEEANKAAEEENAELEQEAEDNSDDEEKEEDTK